MFEFLDCWFKLKRAEYLLEMLFCCQVGLRLDIEEPKALELGKGLPAIGLMYFSNQSCAIC